MPDVFAFVFVKCRAFEAGVTGKCFCSVTGLSEPPQPSPSHTPGSLHAEFRCCGFVRLLLLARQMLLCAEVPERQSQRWCGGWETRRRHTKCESGASVLSPSLFPFLLGRQS